VNGETSLLVIKSLGAAKARAALVSAMVMNEECILKELRNGVKAGF
jgi:hypothetical protein